MTVDGSDQVNEMEILRCGSFHDNCSDAAHSPQTPGLVVRNLSRNVVFELILCMILLLTLPFAPADAAGVLEADELAIGEWDLKLSGIYGFNPSCLFPRPVGLGRETLSKEQQSRIRAQEGGLFKSMPTRRQPLPWIGKRSGLECHLTINSDGTFIMIPDESSSVLPLRGRWKVQANPYCVTDRSYDQITLKAYPRVGKKLNEKKIREGGVDDDSWESQRVEVCLNCKLWGRYGSTKGGIFGKWRPNYIRGRMTHGTMVWDVKDDDSKSGFMDRWKPRRSVVASFSASRSKSQSNVDGQGSEFQEVFGY